MPSVLLVTALLTAQTPAVRVDISGPAAGAASCVIVAPSADTASGWTSRPLTDGRWSCGKNELLQCNAEGFEPLDTPATACAAGRVSVRMRRGAPVRLTLQGSATLEWRAVGVRGTQLLATRALPASSDVLIAEPRVLRVHRPGRAPISLVARPGAKLVIPAGVEGGELFGRVLGDVIRPERVHFKGLTQASAEVTADGFYASPALVPGSYVIEAEYRGGIRSAGSPQTVAAGRTTERFGVGTPNAGGLTVAAETDICVAGNILALTQVLPTASGNASKVFVQRTLTGGDCDIAIDGLAPGMYVATINGPSRLVALENMIAIDRRPVVSERRSAIRLQRPSTVLMGTVSFGDRLQSNMPLALRETGTDGEEFWATTDSIGRYAIAVPAPGSYELLHRVSQLNRGAAVRVALSPGETHYDWKLPATRLTLTFVTTDGLAMPPDLMVAVSGPNGSFLGSTFSAESEGHTITLPGIPFGTYRASAYANGIISADRLTISLTESNPIAHHTIRLEAVVPLTVRVLRPDGTVLENAKTDTRFKVLQPGTFDIREASPGSPVIIEAPGYVPRCVTVQRSHRPSFDVTMTALSPGQATFRFNPPLGDWAPPGRVFGLPGSDCPVPLALFTEVSRRTEGNATVVTIGGLPLGTFEYAPTLRYPPQPLHVPGPELGFMIRPRPPQ
jgi:hypothetical protein